MAKYHKPEVKVIQELKNVAHKLRIDSINATNASNSGHPTSCSSIAEIMSVLFFHTMKYNLKKPKDAANDRLILSKGHAAPILYAAWAEAGLFPVSDLLNLRKVDSDLEGHPTPRLNFIDVGTGSLGQGLSIACGMSYVGKYYDEASYRTYCILGDGESAEGSVWEAMNFASYYKLDNLCAIFDVNRLGQSEPTALEHQMDVYRNRVESFGFHTIVVDGHDVEELCKAFYEASITKGKPTAIIAKTLKGKYFTGIEDMVEWHGKPLGEKADGIIKTLTSYIKNESRVKIQPQAPEAPLPPAIVPTVIKLSSSPSYKTGDKVATRLAYGNALAKIAESNIRIIGLDGDTKNSTYSDKIKKAFPDRYIECFIAEQNLVGVAIGASCRGRTIPFVSTFATFFTRAFDQIRMAAISQANVKFVGSHCGVSIGEDGPSQMALEDLAMFRAVPGSTVFYPSDAVSTEKAVELAANIEGICFIRTSRPNTSILYSVEEEFSVGSAKVVKSSNNDKLLIIGAGVTLHEALDAAAELETKHKINVCVIDPFTIKPIDKETIITNAEKCGGKILTVEDHYSEGGLGEAVMSAVCEKLNIVVRKLAVSEIPRSGPPSVLLDMYGISSKNIVKHALSMI